MESSHRCSSRNQLSRRMSIQPVELLGTCKHVLQLDRQLDLTPWNHLVHVQLQFARRRMSCCKCNLDACTATSHNRLAGQDLSPTKRERMCERWSSHQESGGTRTIDPELGVPRGCWSLPEEHNLKGCELEVALQHLAMAHQRRSYQA